MFSKYLNPKFFVILSIVLSIIVLFPPIYPSSYIFIFSDSYFSIRIDILIFELFLGILLSYLLYFIVFISTIKTKILLLIFLLSSLFSFFAFLIFPPLSSLFSPSLASFADKENRLYTKYSALINNRSISDYINVGEYYTPVYLFSKHLNNYYVPGTYDYVAEVAIYNSISLPSHILPSISSFIYKIENIDSASGYPAKTSNDNFARTRNNTLLLSTDKLLQKLSELKQLEFNKLPQKYRSYNAIPNGYRLDAFLLNDSLYTLKYSYVKANYSDLFDFYKSKSETYLSITSYYKVVSTLKYYVSIFLFVMFTIFFYYKRSFFISLLNSFFIKP